MPKINRNLMVILSVLLVVGLVLVGGCSSKQDTPTQIIENVTPAEASALIQENQNNADFVIIDVRTAAEFAEGHIEDAIMIDFYASTFRDDLDELDKDKIYLIYCRSGNRSGQSLAIMEDLGFLEVHHLASGINAWKAAELPVVTE